MQQVRAQKVTLISLSSWKPWEALGIERASEKSALRQPTNNIRLLGPMPCEAWSKPHNYSSRFFTLVYNLVTDSSPLPHPMMDGFRKSWVSTMRTHKYYLSSTLLSLYFTVSRVYPFSLSHLLFVRIVMSTEFLKDHKTSFSTPTLPCPHHWLPSWSPYS